MSAHLTRTIFFPAAALVALGSACEKPKPTYEGPYATQVAQAVPMIEKAVGLKFKTPPRVETRSKEQVRQYIVKQVSDSQAVRELNGEEAAYKRFGLIPDTLKLQPFLESLLVEQIVGFYDPHTKILYIVDGSPKDLVATIVTHELVHALQDQ